MTITKKDCKLAGVENIEGYYKSILERYNKKEYKIAYRMYSFLSDKAKVLAALYNNSKPQGLGFLHFNPTNRDDFC